MIYLDNAATTKPLPEVIEEVKKYLDEMWYNPSSLYSNGSKIREKINEAKEVIAKSINSDLHEIYFTSCASESNSWVIQGFIKYCKKHNKKPYIITSAIEHKSIMNCIKDVGEFTIISVNNKGFVDLNKLESILTILTCCQIEKYEILVSIQAVNNEIGVLQPLKKISKICHSYNAYFHTDAVQLYGKKIIDVKYLGIDAMSVSGHKIHAPKGIGFLYKSNKLKIDPLIYGTQEFGLRGGTENVPYIMGLKKAVEMLSPQNVYKNMVRMERMHLYLLNELLKRKFVINGSLVNSRIYGIINVTIPENISSESLLYMLDTVDIYISPGSACNSLLDKPSYVLKAIGLSDEKCKRSFRISFGDEITTESIDKFLYHLDNELNLLKS